MTMTPLAVLDTTGETAYVSKHNGNYAAIQTVLNILLERTATLPATATMTAFDAIFGPQTAFIGEDSYAATIDPGDSTQLLVGPGSCYRYSTRSPLTNTVAETALLFAGQAAGTYYVRAEADGTPSFSTDSTDALWSVAWDTTDLTALTRIARTVWGYQDWLDAQTSTKFGETFLKLNDRLDRIEGFFSCSPSFNKSGTFAASATLLRFIATEPCDFAAALAGSFVELETAPADGTWTGPISKVVAGSPTAVGSVAFAIGTTTSPTLTLSGGLHLNAGEALLFQAPATPDSAAAGIAGTFKGTR